jgi:hypothetical protein
LVQEKAQMRKIHRKRGGRLRRQLALGLLQEAMSKADKGRSYPGGAILGDTPARKSYEVAVGVPDGLEIVEYVDARHPYPIRKPLPVMIGP